MKVLVVGSGAREHAIVRALARSPLVAETLATPGNAGIAVDARVLAARVDDVDAIVRAAQDAHVDLVIIGPEAPLVAGLADRLRSVGIATFGPGASAARLEGSKSFAKEFMARHQIPTAAFASFDDADAAHRYVDSLPLPPVVKADGLAAGKGVVVASSHREAHDAIDTMMKEKTFGDAGARVVLEECIDGEEISFHVLVTDSGEFVSLGGAQDHKRLRDGDSGPNTGGMGAYAPVPLLDATLEERVLREIVVPSVRGLRSDGLAYRGVLFVGVMVRNGVPYVLEYNVRFGDPECAVLLARLDTDVAALLVATANGSLSNVPSVQRHATIAVVLAAAGYPTTPRRGDAIRGISDATTTDVDVLHAGTAVENGVLCTAGGRVLTVVARGSDIDEAAARAYRAIELLHFDGCQYRRDIGWRARRRLEPDNV